MENLERAKADILKAYDDKTLISFSLPGWGGYALSITTDMYQHGIHAWKAMHPAKRQQIMRSVRRSVKRLYRRMAMDRATREELDVLAADAALWLTHDVLFADGEKYLVKGPDRETFASA